MKKSHKQYSKKVKSYRIKSRRLIVVAGVIFALLVIFVVYPAVASFIQTKAAEKEVKTARDLISTDIEKQLSIQVNILQQKDILQNQIDSSKVDICLMVPNYAGIFIDGWRQLCYLRYVEGYETVYDKKTLEGKLDKVAMNTAIFGRKYIPSQGSDNNCTLYEQVGNDTITFLDRKRNSEYGCEVPGSLGDIDSISSESKIKTNIYKDLQENKTPAKNQVWIVVQKEYYREDLKCQGIFFCFYRNEPIITPMIFE